MSWISKKELLTNEYIMPWDTELPKSSWKLKCRGFITNSPDFLLKDVEL